MSPYVVAASSEVHYFDVDANFKRGLDWYRKQMPLSYSNQVILLVLYHYYYYYDYPLKKKLSRYISTIVIYDVIQDDLDIRAAIN